MMSYLDVSKVSHRYGTTQVLDGCSFSVEKGELVALLGESGSGKTTLLRLLAGFERPSSGSIRLKGETLCSEKAFVLPEKRNIGLVFQDYALFPHLNVQQNIQIGQKPSSRRKANEWLSLVGLEGLEKRKPDELSGGQQQRVAIARAMAAEPEVLLLDEPFSNIDESLKFSFRSALRELLRSEGTTAVFVTHDTKDALAVADKVVVIKDGEIRQVGTPREVYDQPSDTYVAGLLGPYTLLSKSDQEATIIRAEDCWVLAKSEATEGDYRGQVRSSMYQGRHYLVEVEGSDGLIMGHSLRPFAPHEEVAYSLPKTSIKKVNIR